MSPVVLRTPSRGCIIPVTSALPPLPVFPQAEALAMQEPRGPVPLAQLPFCL